MSRLKSNPLVLLAALAIVIVAVAVVWFGGELTSRNTGGKAVHTTASPEPANPMVPDPEANPS